MIKALTSLSAYSSIFWIEKPFLCGAPIRSISLSILSDADKTDVQSFISVATPALTVVDGYIVSGTTFNVKHEGGTAVEAVAADIEYTCPVDSWITKMFVSGTTTATVRVFFGGI